MKTWILLAAMAFVFSSVGAVLMVIAVATSTWPLLAGGVFLVVGLVMAWFVPSSRREQNADLSALPTAAAGTVPFERVAELIRERLAGTPYTVELTGAMIRVHADLADAAFLGWASAHRVRVVRGLEVVATRPGVAITRGYEQGFELSAGAGRLSGNAQVQSGRSWSYERRIELGVGTDGSLGRQVDIDFSSKDLQDPVNAVLRETGWHAGSRASLPADGKVGAITAGFTVVGLAVAGVVVGVLAILGKLG